MQQPTDKKDSPFKRSPLTGAMGELLSSVEKSGFWPNRKIY